MIPFLLIHIAALGFLYTGVRPVDVALCIGLYLVRMFGITAGFHRYFAHRTFKTGRIFQFILALLGGFSSQQGALWWAAKHREHHKFSDTPQDSHSPKQFGFWFAHIGWVFSASKQHANLALVKDFEAYPELYFLNKHYYLPPALLGFIVFLLGGPSAFFFGFLVSTVITFHCTFAINSIAHVIGTRPYVTSDDSRNNFVLAILTLGEGWHNNHHYYQSSTRQGFMWWQIDITYYALRALALLGLVWDIKEPSAKVIEGNRRLPVRSVDYAAGRLSQKLGKKLPQFPDLEPMNAEMREKMILKMHTMREAWESRKLSLKELAESMSNTLREMGIDPQEEISFPSLETVRQQAHKMFRHTTSASREEIVARAYMVMAVMLAGGRQLPT